MTIPDDVVHVAMFPSAGMGHLTPFLRLATLLLRHHCKVTIITALPTVSLAESQLLSRFKSSFPDQLNILPLHLPPPPPPPPSSSSTHTPPPDPFFLRVQLLRTTPVISNLLPPLLSSLSPPLSAFVSDIFLITPLIPLTNTLSLPNYTLFTSSASMFSFFSRFPTLSQSLTPSSSSQDLVHIPGIPFSPIPKSFIPPVFFQPNTIFGNQVMEDSPKITKVDGVFVNTFEALESESLKALNDGKVVKGMPPVYAVGPFVQCEFEKESEGDERGGATLKWLDDQPSGSVVFVCFGSRTTLGREQMREIGEGLMKSRCRFLWVVKDKIVDREEDDREVGLDEVLGVELVKRMKERGLVVKEWVDQSEILGHKSVGGFVSHCGWNSLIEAAWNGVPILGWPQHGDQKINAGLVEMSGWGIWKHNWGWAGEALVKGEVIGEAVKEMMENQSLKDKAAQLNKCGRKALEIGGECDVNFQKVIGNWKKMNY